MKYRSIIIFCLVLGCSPLSAQTDSLKGYSMFRFGQSKSEIINILNNNNVLYDTLPPGDGVTLNDVIIYRDTVEALYFEEKFSNVDIEFIDLNEYLRHLHILNVELHFAPFPDSHFYEAKISIKEPCESLSEAGVKLEKLLKIMESKYGPNYVLRDYSDTLKYSLSLAGIPRTKAYKWSKPDGSVNMVYSTGSFFVKDGLDYTNILTEGGEFDVTITYDNIGLEMENFNRYLERQEQWWENKMKQIKSKF